MLCICTTGRQIIYAPASSRSLYSKENEQSGHIIALQSKSLMEEGMS